MKRRPIIEIMHEGGYLSTAEAAEAIGVAHVSSVLRQIADGRLRGAQAGKQWFVSVFSLLRLYPADRNPVIHERILATGVKPVPEPSPSEENDRRYAKFARRRR